MLGRGVVGLCGALATAPVGEDELARPARLARAARVAPPPPPTAAEAPAPPPGEAAPPPLALLLLLVRALRPGIGDGAALLLALPLSLPLPPSLSPLPCSEM